jgi:hypothetical protein
MTDMEFNGVFVVIFLQLMGAYIFTKEYPDPWPTVFGYHEIFHIFVVLAGITVYLLNWSIIRRTCNPYSHELDVLQASYNLLGSFFNTII